MRKSANLRSAASSPLGQIQVSPASLVSVYIYTFYGIDVLSPLVFETFNHARVLSGLKYSGNDLL